MTMYTVHVCVYIFILLSGCFGEKYNLYGDAGQAYAVEVNLGHPYQKVVNTLLRSFRLLTKA